MISTISQADPIDPAQPLPPAPVGVRSEVNGVQVRCYNFQEQAQIDRERQILLWALPEIASLRLQKISLETSVKTLEHAVEIEKRRGDEIDLILQETRKAAKKDEKLDRIMVIVPWSIAGVETITFTVIAIWAASQVAAAAN